MLRKNKKPKHTSGLKLSNENETTKSSQEVKAKKESEVKESEVFVAEKTDKMSLCLPLEKKLKMQMKRQKKKEKKREFEEKNVKVVKECEVESVDSEKKDCAENGENCSQGQDLILEKSIVQVDVNKPDGNICEITKEEKVSLPQSIKTTEAMVKSKSKEQNEVECLKPRFHIETIPEDLFEEFIENEEIIQTKEAIKAFPRTSPMHSPTSQRRDPFQVTTPAIVVNSPPKIFYNYCGAVYTDPVSSRIGPESIENGYFVTYTNSDQDLCANRKLDVIIEESDFSDTSGYSERKSNVIKKGISEASENSPQQIFSLDEQVEKSDKNDAIANNSFSVLPVVKETLKISNDVVKIELAESGSEGEYDINQRETFTESIAHSKDSTSAKTEDNSRSQREMTDCSDKSSWSMKSISSTSTKPLEDESESVNSSFNQEYCDGAEADVESELDSQRAATYGEIDDDFDVKIPDLTYDSINDGIQIFMTNYKDFSPDNSKKKDELVDRDNSTKEYYSGSDNLFEEKLSEDNRQNVSSEKNPEQVTELSTMSTDDDCLTSFVEDISTEDFFYIPICEESNRSRVNVKNMANAMKNDIDNILISKMKVMQQFKEIPLNEESWRCLVRESKKECKKENSFGFNEKPKPLSDCSSYENVSKSEKFIPKPQTIPEIPQNPEALSNLAEKKILTLPYGKLVLKKIGLGKCCSNDSESIKEDMYMKTNHQQNKYSPAPSPVPSDTSARSFSGKSNKNEDVVESRSYIEFDYSNPKIGGEREKWYGTPTAVPAVLLGLSPAQKKTYEEAHSKFMPEEAEAARLLDLHQKFFERRSYHEPHKEKERSLLFESKIDKGNSVAITDICGLDKVSEKENKSPTENKKLEIKIVKEERIGKEIIQSSNTFDNSPKTLRETLIENKNVESKDVLRCANGVHEKKEDSENVKGGRNAQKVRENNERVGKSCLLALLQNATSDDSVPELNTDTSIESTSESHEEYLLQNLEAMMNRWQNNPVFESVMKDLEEMSKGETSDEGQKTFEQIWNKEKNITFGDRVRPNLRPKTICFGKESDIQVNEPKFEKKIIAPKKTGFGEKKMGGGEKLIITERLPTVSDVIKSFEEPKSRPPSVHLNNGKTTQIQIDNEKYNVSKKGDIAVIQSRKGEKRGENEVKRKSMPASLMSEKETFLQKMYDEYMSKLAERFERRQKKVIKVSNSNEIECAEDTKWFDLENEFISKVKERKEKLGMIPKKAELPSDSKNFFESIEEKCKEFSDYWKEETTNLENGKFVLRGGDFSSEKSKDGTMESSSSKRSSVQIILDPSLDVDHLPQHLKELLQVEAEEFPGFFDGELRLVGFSRFA